MDGVQRARIGVIARVPTYELKCAKCGAVTDLFLQRILRDEDRVCAACGSREVVSGVGGGFVARSSSGATCDPARRIA